MGSRVRGKDQNERLHSAAVTGRCQRSSVLGDLLYNRGMPDEIRYITTPIYYVNDRPHIGHVYTTTICDAYARFQRFAGRDTFFLTGTDEHGVKVEKSAQARNVTPKQLADENAAEFKRVLSTFNLTNDDFIRTTDPQHERQVQAFIK